MSAIRKTNNDNKSEGPKKKNWNDRKKRLDKPSEFSYNNFKMNKKETTIRISHRVWIELNKKKRVGESFNDVLKRVLGLEEKKE